jgi:hypothetical protein
MLLPRYALPTAAAAATATVLEMMRVATSIPLLEWRVLPHFHS